MINHSYFQKLYIDTVGSLPSLISSIDHVYGSFPLRIMDSHNQLLNEDNPQILLWDVTIPYIKKYRLELIFDSGLFVSKSEQYLLFEPENYYCLSKTFLPDFSQQKDFALGALTSCLNIGEKDLIDTYVSRYKMLEEVYTKNISQHHKANDFFIGLLEDLYKLLGMKDLAKLINKKMLSVFESGMIDKYIPSIIELTANEDYGYVNLLKLTDLFKPPYFRCIDVNKSNRKYNDKTYIITHIKDIVELLRNKEILPSHELFFWAWSLSNIKHFGNDFGFLNKLEETFTNLHIPNKVGSLQVSKPKEDGKNFIEFENVVSYTTYKNASGKDKFKKIPSKLSRVSGFTNVYLHLGRDGILKAWENYLKQKEVTKIKMGELIP